ncbi:MAG: ABC transporter ATP-binding protein [Cytophagaceae bacterium]
MGEVVLKIENVSKQYRIGEIGAVTLLEDLQRFISGMKGHNTDERRNIVWALKDINFEVKRGEVLGIIGKNGAGKSTLLKLLSKVVAPSKGQIKIKGRISSLLEVGTGFHPELTGRENVFLNGAIHGMTKSEIARKLDEIIDFSGISKYIDTPVKRYSSGMKVRLGFAVAAHLEPEILIIDEVLAVGDIEFQRKCIGKMHKVSNEGRTILFVSHSMASVKSLCRRGILLNKGSIYHEGTVDEVIEKYYDLNSPLSRDGIKKGNGYSVDLASLSSCNAKGFELTDFEVMPHELNNKICSGGAMDILISYKTTHKELIGSTPSITIKVKDELGNQVFHLNNLPAAGYPLYPLHDQGMIRISIEKLPLVKGIYTMDIAFGYSRLERYFDVENVVQLDVEGDDVYGSGVEPDRTYGLIYVNQKWLHEKI